MLKASPVALLLAAPPARAVTRSPPNKWIARRRLRYASTQVAPSTDPISLAIVGGGLSGLSAAFYYLRALSPEARSLAKVVIFEKEKRVGGWCRSIDITSDKDVAALDRSKGTDAAAKGHASQKLIFETGPRSIRPVGLSGWLTVEMAHEIGLASDIITVDKTAPSAKNRYIYDPPKLVKLPSSLGTAMLSPLTTPLIRAAMPGILLEPFRRRSPLHERPDGGDETVDSFFTRRFGKPLAERMISAMIHGIYAGDTRRLSIRTIFPGLWEAEREWGSVVLSALLGGLWRRRGWKPKSAYRLGVEAEQREMEAIKLNLERSGPDAAELVTRMSKASVWGLRGGIARLTEELRRYLERQGVEIRLGEPACVERDGTGWKVVTPSNHVKTAHVIATSTSPLPESLTLPTVPSTTVSVINIAFPAPEPTQESLFPPGFGYLIPRSVPTSSNPHHVLGVIFDSDVMPEVDRSRSDGFVKISVLLGGSYWLDKKPPPTPSSDELVQAALDTLKLHFPGKAFPQPVHTCTHTHLNCIPQVPPGYSTAVRDFRARLSRLQGGQIGIVGAGLAAVGVNGAVKAAWEVGTSFAHHVERGTPVRTGTDSM